MHLMKAVKKQVKKKKHKPKKLTLPGCCVGGVSECIGSPECFPSWLLHGSNDHLSDRQPHATNGGAGRVKGFKVWLSGLLVDC